MSAIKSWANKQPINPFEDVTRTRLEQSVLSPNLFHINSNNSSAEV